jgi:hypothetical protein
LLGLEEIAHDALDLVAGEAVQVELSGDRCVEQRVARVEAGRLGAAAAQDLACWDRIAAITRSTNAWAVSRVRGSARNSA